MVKASACQQETQVWSLGQEDTLEKEMATHSSFLAWEIPRTEEPRRLHIHGVTKNQIQLSEHKQAPGIWKTKQFWVLSFSWNFSCPRSLPWASPSVCRYEEAKKRCALYLISCLSFCLQIRGSKEKMCSLSHLLSLHPPPAWFGRFILQRRNRLSPCQAVCHSTLPRPLKGETGSFMLAHFWVKWN